jgi:eukaryotic-like serine/threonine-protein kinase
MRYAALGAIAALALVFYTTPLVSQPANAPAAEADMVHLKGFAIDRYEYPNRAGQLPQVNVSWQEALQLCRAKGKRLCLESEWETACRGPQGHIFGYGPSFQSTYCNTPYQDGGGWRRQGLSRSGAFDECTNAYGVFDMLGNAWEWTATRPGSSDNQALRGGSWFNSVNYARADGRYDRVLPADYRLDLIGFRCCLDLPTKSAESPKE